ncbi:MAG: iron-only hydrogenase system regulator [Clostridiales bacterium]|nr:iron-only hydrogenase system regulator [Clostridiales bacterium]MDD6540088.1 iron-only hydrogenase system regulator [Bacillota bacterium]MDD7015931.1 iron-only hydrogenase system regulator [Bacillota bacterium]
MTDNSRTALIGIIVEDELSVARLNEILHEYRRYIIGRMGVPYREKDISIISIAIDAEQSVISALSGKLGALEGVSTKTIYSKK